MTCAASDSTLIPASAAASGSGRGGADPVLTKSLATLAEGFASWADALKKAAKVTTSPREIPSRRIYRTTRRTGTAEPGETSLRKRGSA